MRRACLQAFTFLLVGCTVSVPELNTEPLAPAEPEVQSGTLVLSDGLRNVFVNLDVPAALENSALFFGLRTAETEPRYAAVRGEIVSSERLFFERHDIKGDVEIVWYLVTHPDWRVQRGVLPDFAVQEDSVSIDAVDPGRSLLLTSFSFQGVDFGSDDLIGVELSDVSTVRFWTGDPTPLENRKVAWQVVELGKDAGVQSGKTTLTTASASAAITPVELARSALLFTHADSADTLKTPPDVAGVRGFFASEQELGFEREASSGLSLEVSWFAATFAAAQVRPITVRFDPGQDQVISPLAGVDPTRSIVFSSHQGIAGSGDGTLPTWSGIVATHELGDASELISTRGQSSDAATLETYVVTF